MTALNATQIPVAVNTLEAHLAWAALAFYKLHQRTEYQQERNGPNVPIVTLMDGLAEDGTERAIFTISLKMNPAWRESANPMWLEVMEISSSLPMPEAWLA